MKSVSLIDQRYELSETAFVEMVVWQPPTPVRGSNHGYKYRMALMSDGLCVLRYDNEAGKGDHKHIGPRQFRYDFSDLETLYVDFWTDVDEWLKKKRR
jgi:hypothetical protein